MFCIKLTTFKHTNNQTNMSCLGLSRQKRDGWQVGKTDRMRTEQAKVDVSI